MAEVLYSVACSNQQRVDGAVELGETVVVAAALKALQPLNAAVRRGDEAVEAVAL